MTNDKKKALQIYGLGIFVVVLCVGAGWLHLEDKCARTGGKWGTFSGCKYPTNNELHVK